MAAIFGLGGPIILPWAVRGDRFRGGTVHGVTALFRWIVQNQDCLLSTTKKLLNSHQTLFLVRGWGLGLRLGGLEVLMREAGAIL